MASEKLIRWSLSYSIWMRNIKSPVSLKKLFYLQTLAWMLLLTYISYFEQVQDQFEQLGAKVKVVYQWQSFYHYQIGKVDWKERVCSSSSWFKRWDLHSLYSVSYYLWHEQDLFFLYCLNSLFASKWSSQNCYCRIFQLYRCFFSWTNSIVSRVYKNYWWCHQ